MPALHRHDYRRGCGSGYVLLIFALALLLYAGVSEAEEKSAAASSMPAPVLIRLQINGILLDHSVMALRTPQQTWLLPVEALRSARIHLDQAPKIHFNDTDFQLIPAEQIKKMSFDEASQTLDMQIDTSAFQQTRLQPERAVIPRVPDAGAGLFINYDVLLEHNALGLRQSLFSELGAAVGPGVATSSHAYIRIDETNRHLRLDTTYTIDRPSERASWRLGDAISRPGRMLGRPVRFGGLQYSTNFQTQPGLVLTPMTTLDGQAALPSTVDLYVNNVLQNSRQIPPGPFSVSAAPVVAGDGEVSMRVRDIAGREEIISQRFYASTALLSPGLSDFSVEAGFLRRNFGRESQDYGDFFASASYRLGLTPTLTVEGNLQAQPGVMQAASGGLAKAFPGIGTATLALAYSHSNAGDGVQGLIGLERRSGRHSFALRSQMASENFRQIGIDTPQTVRRMDTAFWGYRMDGIGSFSLSYISQQLGDFRPIDIYSASYSTARHAWGTFVVSATQSRSEISQSSVYFLWVLALEREVSASLMHLQGQNQREQTIFQVNKSLPPGEGIGYRLQTAINASQQAAVFAQNRFGQGRLEAASLNDQTSARVGISGAVARLDDQWYLTRRIGSSYGLVRMPGLNNVRVYVDNQLATRTNSGGYAFLPRLHPYQRNHVSVEQMDLPMNATIESLTVNPVPGWRSGIVIDFPVRQQAAATLNLFLADGSPVPAGALVRLNNSEASFAVGRDGLTFVAGLENENQLEVNWGDRQCQAIIPFTASAEMAPHLGEFVCRAGDK